MQKRPGEALYVVHDSVIHQFASSLSKDPGNAAVFTETLTDLLAVPDLKRLVEAIAFVGEDANLGSARAAMAAVDESNDVFVTRRQDSRPKGLSDGSPTPRWRNWHSPPEGISSALRRLDPGSTRVSQVHVNVPSDHGRYDESSHVTIRELTFGGDLGRWLQPPPNRTTQDDRVISER